MSRAALITLLLAAPVATIADDAPLSPRSAMREGRASFGAGDFTDAAKAFRDAAQTARERGLDPAVARYNEGTALARSEALGPAIDALTEAARTPDPALQAKAQYNLGAALLERAKIEESAQQLQPALQSTTEALDAFDRAMALDPSDRDTKVNYEWATVQAERLQQEIQRQQQEQQQNQQGQDQEQQQDPPQQDGQQQAPQDSSEDPQQPREQQGQTGDEPQPQQQDGGDEQSDEAQQQGQQGQAGEAEDDAARDARRMSETEAETLLDAMKAREQGLREQVARDRLRQGAGQLAPVEKDW